MLQGGFGRIQCPHGRRHLRPLRHDGGQRKAAATASCVSLSADALVCHNLATTITGRRSSSQHMGLGARNSEVWHALYFYYRMQLKFAFSVEVEPNAAGPGGRSRGAALRHDPDPRSCQTVTTVRLSDCREATNNPPPCSPGTLAAARASPSRAHLRLLTTHVSAQLSRAPPAAALPRSRTRVNRRANLRMQEPPSTPTRGPRSMAIPLRRHLAPGGSSSTASGFHDPVHVLAIRHEEQFHGLAGPNVGLVAHVEAPALHLYGVPALEHAQLRLPLGGDGEVGLG